MMRIRRYSTRRILSVFAATCVILSVARGQSVWNAPTGDWADPTKWTPAGVPNGVTATISNGGTATVNTVVAEMPTAINVGSGAGTSGRLDIVAGSLTAAAGGSVTIGSDSSSGVFNIANTAGGGAGITGFAQGGGSFTTTGTFGVGGTLTTPTTPVPGVGIMRIHTTGTVATGDTVIGVGPGGDGKVFMESGTWNSTGVTGFGVGVAGGLGLFNMSGGSLSVAADLAIGYANGDGTFNLANTGVVGAGLTGFGIGTGSIAAGVSSTDGIHLGDSGAAGKGTLRVNTSGTITSGVVRVGQSGTGVVLMDAGVWTNALDVQIGAGAGGIGTFSMGGGSLTSGGEIRVATTGSTGTMNVSGGTVTTLVENGVNVGRGAGALGTMNITGGVVQGGSINIGYEGGDGTVNISGGELIGGGATGYINVGENGSTGKVIQTGGKITIGAWMAVGLGGTGPQAEYHISGGEVLGNAIEVGADRAGVMTITGTANVHPNVLEIATRATGNGTVVLNSPTAVVTLNELSIGSRGDSPGGQGLLNFQSGALNVAQFNIGRGGPGTYTQTGSLATVQRFHMGVGAGASTANLGGNGSMLYEEVRVGLNASGPVVLNIADNYVMQGKTGLAFDGSPNQHFGSFNAGEGSSGTVAINQTGGTVAFSAWMSLGIGTGPADPALQTYTISGGVIKDNRDQPDPRPLPFPDPPLADRRLAALEVGSDHGFTMNVLPGATINVQDITTGHRANGNGIYNQSGGQVTVNGWMWAGREGRGTVNVTGGNLDVAGRMYVGDFNVAVGEMNVNYPAGSTDRVRVGELRVAANPNIVGTLNVKSGKLQLDNYSEIGRGPGSNGTVNIDGPNALLEARTLNNQDMQVGIGGGTGNLNIKNGGQMIHNWWVNIARDAGSVGQVTVDGAGSKLTNTNGRINVGEHGTGNLNVANGGLVEQPLRAAGPGLGQDAEFTVGRETGSQGVLNISGADSKVIANYVFRVGATPGATGTVNITGGTLKLNGWTEIGRNGGTGTVNIDGPTAFLDASETRDNYADNYTGNANPRDLFVGLREPDDTGSGNGSLNIKNGGKMTHNWWLGIARGAGTVGQVTVDGAGSKFTNTNGVINVGEQGTGTLNVTNGGVFEMLPRPATNPAADFIVGRDGGSTGVVNLSGVDSRINTQGWAYIGLNNGSNGTVNQSGGTFNAGDWLVVADQTGSTGQYNLTGGTINVTTNFLMGRFGTGRFVQTAGTVNVGGWVLVGADPSGRGEYDLVGGTFTQNHPTESFVVGRLGNADNINDPPSRFTISNTGELNRIGGGAMIIGEDRHGNGLLEVKNGGKLTNPTEMNVGIGRGNPNAAGEGGGAATGKFVVDGGTVTNGSIFVGRGRGADPIPDPVTPGSFIPGPSYAAVGTVEMLGGTVTTNGFVRIGTEGATGTLTMSGGTLTSTGEFAAGVDGASTIGTVTQTGGLIHTDLDLTIGRNDNAQGTFNLGGTGQVQSGGSVYLGRFGTATGTLAVTGGGLQAAGDIVLAADPANAATFTMSDGLVNAAGNLIVAPAGTATLSHTGGTISAQNVFIGDGVTNTPVVTVAGLHTGPVDVSNSLNARNALTVRGGTLDVGGPIIVGAASTLEVTGPTVLVNVPGPAGTATDGALRSTSNLLQVNGTLTVDSGQGVVRAGLSGTTVSGTGIIDADLNVINGATLAPGTPPGNLSVTGDLIFDSSANFSVDILGGSLYDSVTVNGAVTLAGSHLSGLTPTPLTISSGEVFYVIRNMGLGAVGGIFAGAPDGSTVTMGIWTFQISYDANFETSSFDTGGNDVALKALIPEPASLLLLGSGVALMLGRRRRKA